MYASGSSNPEPIRQNRQTGGGLAIAGMIVGIVGLLFCWIPIFGFFVTLTGLILSAFGMKSRERGMAIAGLVMSIIGILISLLMSTILIVNIIIDSPIYSYPY